ncbi:hypothetical protein A7P54_15545 [Acinetobacter sp. Ac_3412]|uniref:GTPase-associated system all-helical protein GASH n=1 Tax=Acinetobacter sp. Ac_3412 TaxID=1848935 RepID=UPI00148FED41|nr:GTPase-associated system all-helical protein GASH [Acinetobacter sp. Ac_3412]NNP77819.1 hypothetical protein [Acinetobacter sp. Ac_3412]
MSMTFLEALKKAGSLDKQITENDERFDKANAAAEEFAEKMDPKLLIDGCNALIKESFFESNLAMQSAYSTLENNWSNVGLVYQEDKPNRLLTAMVLYACEKLTNQDIDNASKLALNLIDIWPYLSINNNHLILTKEQVDEWNKKLNIQSFSVYKETIDIKTLRNKTFKNDGFQNEGENEASAEKIAKNFTDTFKELNEQINLVSSSLKSPFEYQNEQLAILWWYEAKYSQSFFRSYREIDVLLRPLIMAIDLLTLIKEYPAPVSSTYILAESVNQTENANYDKKYPLIDILTKIRESKAELLAKDIFNALELSPNKNCLNIRDLVVSAFKTDIDIETLKNQCIVQIEEISLPDLAKAIYRQEQAYRL